MLKHPKATEDAIGCGINLSQVILKSLKNLKKTGKKRILFAQARRIRFFVTHYKSSPRCTSDGHDNPCGSALLKNLRERSRASSRRFLHRLNRSRFLAVNVLISYLDHLSLENVAANRTHQSAMHFDKDGTEFIGQPHAQ